MPCAEGFVARDRWHGTFHIYPLPHANVAALSTDGSINNAFRWIRRPALVLMLLQRTSAVPSAGRGPVVVRRLALGA